VRASSHTMFERKRGVRDHGESVSRYCCGEEGRHSKRVKQGGTQTGTMLIRDPSFRLQFLCVIFNCRRHVHSSDSTLILKVFIYMQVHTTKQTVSMKRRYMPDLLFMQPKRVQSLGSCKFAHNSTISLQHLQSSDLSLSIDPQI
jgi:hypothetical protein